MQFVDSERKVEIGEALFKSNYISIDLLERQMLFSPLNRYPSESLGVYIVRAFVGFFFFMIVSMVAVMIWQTFNDPFHKHKLSHSQDGGVRLVSYQRPLEYEE